MAELIAYAKANPGKLNFGSAGVGSAPHMGIALISVAAGIDMVHVPFAGLGPDDQCADGRHGRSRRWSRRCMIKPHVESGACASSR